MPLHPLGEVLLADEVHPRRAGAGCAAGVAAAYAHDDSSAAHTATAATRIDGPRVSRGLTPRGAATAHPEHRPQHARSGAMRASGGQHADGGREQDEEEQQRVGDAGSRRRSAAAGRRSRDRRARSRQPGRGLHGEDGDASPPSRPARPRSADRLGDVQQRHEQVAEDGGDDGRGHGHANMIHAHVVSAARVLGHLRPRSGRRFCAVDMSATSAVRAGRASDVRARRRSSDHHLAALAPGRGVRPARWRRIAAAVTRARGRPRFRRHTPRRVPLYPTDVETTPEEAWGSFPRLAVAVGFEPTEELPPHTLSRRAP